MSAKSGRMEFRADPAEDKLITEAAKALGHSKSKFILFAAVTEANKVLARSDHVLMDADAFDQLIDSLDTPDPAPNLAAIASQKRRFRRR